jgi:tRNA pseudouridine55 synthase
VDKPAGITSHDVIQRVRRALGTRAVGHTGTLDPFATGLLVVLVGRATRLARFVEAQPKTYLATARLGIRTETDDLTGKVVGPVIQSPDESEETVRRALMEFAGVQQQRPPSYSAKHVEGERSYRRARRGDAVELPEVTVVVHRIELCAYRQPEVTFRATVSAGTYLRAVARDLGERLGVGAHLIALRREAVGPLRVEDAIPLDRVTRDALVPVRRVLGHLPSVELDEPERQAVAHGRAVGSRRADGPGTREAGGGRGAVVLLGSGEVVAVAREEGGKLRPTVVLAEP